MADMIVIRPAHSADLPAIISLLSDCDLYVPDLATGNLGNYHIAETEDHELVGIIGLHRVGSQAVLHSIAVVSQYRGRGLGGKLLNQCETAALIAGIDEIYVPGTTASNFFRHVGYQDISRAVVPSKIATHHSFFSDSSSNAGCLGKIL